MRSHCAVHVPLRSGRAALGARASRPAVEQGARSTNTRRAPRRAWRPALPAGRARRRVRRCSTAGLEARAPSGQSPRKSAALLHGGPGGPRSQRAKPAEECGVAPRRAWRPALPAGRARERVRRCPTAGLEARAPSGQSPQKSAALLHGGPGGPRSQRAEPAKECGVAAGWVKSAALMRNDAARIPPARIPRPRGYSWPRSAVRIATSDWMRGMSWAGVSASSAAARQLDRAASSSPAAA